MFGLKDQDLMFVLFVVFGFFLAKMLSSKKEGYSHWIVVMPKANIAV